MSNCPITKTPCPSYPDCDGCAVMPYKQKKPESIHHPSHYNFSKFEPKDVIRDWNLNFNLGNVIKYVARAGKKGDLIEDLKKARQYLDFEIQYQEGEQKHG